MNKHILKVKDLLSPLTYDAESDAKYYLEEVLDTNKFKPPFITKYEDESEHYASKAITLNTSSIGYNEQRGVTVIGKVHCDYYEWVNFFLAISDNGKDYIVGDFEKTLYCSSEIFYNKFLESYKIEVWDYWDI